MTALQKILRKIRASSKDDVFNLHMKTAAPTMQQFLLEKERRRQMMETPIPPPPEAGVVPTQAPPIPTTVVPMEQPSAPPPKEQVSTALPGEYALEEVSNYMDQWVYEHKGAMEEYERELEQAQMTGGSPPSLENVEIGPDLKLYKMLMKDPKNIRMLIEKVEDTALPGKGRKANLFVGTMLNSTKFLFKDLEEANRQQQQQDLARAQMEQAQPPVEEEAPVELPDKHLDVMAHLILVDERIKWQNILKMWRYPQGNVDEQKYQAMVADAAAQQLGAPEPGQSDPRMEFFLKYPKYLEPIISGDPDFQKRFLSELSGIGLSGDVFQDLSKLFTQRNKGPILSFLAREKGEEIQGVLSKLVDALPNQPDVMEWLKKGIFETEQTQTIGGPASFYQGPEAEQGMVENITKGKERIIREDEIGEQLRKKKELERAEDMMDRATKKIAAIGKYYLKDVVGEMEQLAEASIQKGMEKQMSKYRDAIDVGEKKKALRTYTQLEKMHIFSQGAMNQLEQLFIDYRNPKPSKKDVSMMRYQNNLGTVLVPTSLVKQIFGFDKDETRVDRFEKIKDFESAVDIYKDSVKRGEVKDAFEPEWRKMVNYRVPFLAMAEAGKLKSGIIDIASPKQGTVTLDGIFKTIEKNTTGLRDILNKYVGLEKDKMPTLKQTQKKKDFIYMTLRQKDEHSAGLSLYLEKYKQKKDIEKKYKNKEDIKSAQRRAGKNTSAEFGTKFPPILPYIIQVMDGQDPEGLKGEKGHRFSDKALRGLIDLFDHHRAKIRGFTGTGRAINHLDLQGRTNTELYYLARREEMPKDMREGLLFSQDKGLSELNERLMPIKRQIEKKQIKKDKVQDTIRQRLEDANAKLQNVIGKGVSPNVANKNLNRASEKIRDPLEREKFLNDMKTWQATGDNSELPHDYYALLGQKTFEKIMLKAKEMIAQQDEGVPINKRAKKPTLKELGLTELNTLLEKKQSELDGVLAQKGLKASESGFRLLEAAYPRFLKRIESLNRMRQHNYKISHIGSIDKFANDAILEYDQFIMSIFPRL